MRFAQSLLLFGSSLPLLSAAVSAMAISPDKVVHLADRSLRPRDAFVSQQAGQLSGDPITTISVPFSAQQTSIPIGDSGAKIFGYWGRKPLTADQRKAKRAYVVIHGRDRNANEYYSTLNVAYNKAIEAGITDDPYSIRYGPDFFSAELDDKVLNSTTLAWGDPNAWSGGDGSVYPARSNISPFDVLDGILDKFTSKKNFPNLEKVVFLGHGAGAQMLQRYAVVGKSSPTSRVSVRYVIGEPSSMLYFTVDRAEAVRESCTWYNDFRYGLSNYDLPNYDQTYSLGGRSKQGFFSRYLRRDVRYLIGMLDSDPDSGDQTCPAVSQGGAIRRDRALNYWAYLHLLAGIKPTPEYPGYFPALDDDSSKEEKIPDKRYTYRKSSKNTIAKYAQDAINHVFYRVPMAAHTATSVFTSDEGLEAIFS